MKESIFVNYSCAPFRKRLKSDIFSETIHPLLKLMKLVFTNYFWRFLLKTLDSKQTYHAQICYFFNDLDDLSFLLDCFK